MGQPCAALLPLWALRGLLRRCAAWEWNTPLQGRSLTSSLCCAVCHPLHACRAPARVPASLCTTPARAAALVPQPGPAATVLPRLCPAGGMSFVMIAKALGVQKAAEPAPEPVAAGKQKKK